ncbi:MAG: hypothetical protein AAGG48_09410 [Planctomycetota bacterium]
MRSLGDDDAVLDLVVADERLIDQVNGQPVIGGFEYTGQSDVRSGETYLLATLDVASDRSTRWSWLGFGKDKANDHSVAQVWCRVYRVDSSTSGGVELPTVVAEPHRSDLSEERNADNTLGDSVMHEGQGDTVSW